LSHPTSREIPVEPAHTALLFVDVQNYNRLWDGLRDERCGARR
jgi:class 3 adenylate cyclase